MAKPLLQFQQHEAIATKIVAEILQRIDRDAERIVPYCRVNDLIPPFSKPSIYRWLDEGLLRAVKLGGITLIEIESVHELLKTAEPWKAAGQ